jgi:hypothetical protein
MKTRRLKKRPLKHRGGCTRGKCNEFTTKVKSFFYPKPSFPAYEKATLYNKPPGIEFYYELSLYLEKFKSRSPKDIQEACNNIRKFIQSTDASSDVLQDLGEIPFLNKENPTKEHANEMYVLMEALLENIIWGSHQDEQESYFIGYEWSPQEKARIRARMLLPAMSATRHGIEGILPEGSGPGPASTIARLLGAANTTSYVKGTNIMRTHTLAEENQIAALHAVATAVPGSSVGTEHHFIDTPQLPNGKFTPRIRRIRRGSVVHV